ncbi:MAG: hypothetical protein ACRD63_07105, partial [Pyrinomonadaceae bacterium]
MMNRIIFSVLLPVLLVAVQLAIPSSVIAQSANKIIDRYKKASGGSAAKRVRSTLMSGGVKLNDGSVGSFSWKISKPDRMRIEIEVGSAKVSQCYNGKSAWRMDQRGLRTLLGPEAKQLRLESLLANNHLRDLSRDRILMQQPAKTIIEGRGANAIEFIRDGARAKLFFDAATGLLIKQERETAEGIEELFYDDYRAVDKIMESFSIRIRKGSSLSVITIDHLEHNRTVDETDFRYPLIEGASSLPSIEPLMKSIVANQEKIEEMVEHYTYRETETERKEETGQLKDSETKIYEVTPVAGDVVRRLISINGKELSATEREKEDRRVQKEVEELVRKREKRLQKKEQADREKRDDDVTILNLLRASEITSVRREKFRGEEVIAFDFEPRKGFKSKNRSESFFNRLAGTMWVDETARQIVRLEARLTDSFKISGGLLASISPSTAIVIEQE